MWSQAAREAALATRQANAKGQQPQPQQPRKPGPQTAAHPNAGNRVAFAERAKEQHDAGMAARVHAVHQQQLLSSIPHAARGVLGVLLGTIAGAGSAIVKSALRGQRMGGMGRRG